MPRDFNIAEIEADVIPLPIPEITPPEINMNFKFFFTVFGFFWMRFLDILFDMINKFNFRSSNHSITKLYFYLVFAELFQLRHNQLIFRKLV